jgi:hypothetical protein
MTVAPTSLRPERGPHQARWATMAALTFLLGGLTVALLYHFDVFGA